ISRGVPMLLGGDEFGRTQRGNNNAYCQDNEISWYDWTLLPRNRELFRFVQGMIAFRGRHPVVARERFYTQQEIEWFTPAGSSPNWVALDRTLGWRICAHREGGQDLCVLVNAADEAVEFHLPPPPPATRWCIAVDTAAPPPDDLPDPGSERFVDASARVHVRDRAMMVLVAQAP